MKKIKLKIHMKGVDEQELRHLSTEGMQFLLQAGQILYSSLDYKSTLSKLVKLSIPRLGDWCAVDLVDSEGNIRLIAAHHSDRSKTKLIKDLRKKIKVDPFASRGLSMVVKKNKLEVKRKVSDTYLRSISVSDEHYRLLKKIGFSSYIIVPLRSFGKVLGAITFASAGTRNLLTKSDCLVAEILAKRAAVAIENAELYKKAEQEIAERKKTEERLKLSHARLTQMLEGTTDAFFSVDKNWRYTYLNKKSISYSRKTKEELIGNKMWEVFPRVRTARFFAQYEKVMSTRMPVEFEEKLSNGWYEVKAYPLDDGGIGVFYREISDRKQLDQRKDEFISMASHELKTPITSLKLYAELLKKNISSKERSIYLNHMSTQVDKLGGLVEDLLDVSKIQVGKINFKKQYFDLREIVRESVQVMQKTVNKHDIELKLPKYVVPVCADKGRIVQVIDNLLTNAIKYSPEADRIVVTIKKDKKNGYVSVRDYGVGIDRQDHSKIFNRFFQIASRDSHTYPGLGIGLYISKIIADHHSAHIEVESTPGSGSTFHFRIPLKKKNA